MPVPGEQVEAEAAVELTMKVAVAAVLVSVMVSVPAMVPTVSTADEVVFEVTVGVARLAPVPPLNENSVLAVSESHRQGPVQVSAKVGVVPRFPRVGKMPSVAVETVIVVVIESVVSVMVSVPVPEPVVICRVSEVAEEFDLLASVAPVTPEILKAVLPVHAVLTPVQSTAMLLV